MQRLLAEEIALAENTNELLIFGIGLANCHAHLTLRDDEERITTGTLSNNIVTLLIEGLFENIGDLDQRVLRQFLEDRYTKNQ